MRAGERLPDYLPPLLSFDLRLFVLRSALRVVSTVSLGWRSGSRRSAFRRSSRERRSFPFVDPILSCAIA